MGLIRKIRVRLFGPEERLGLWSYRPEALLVFRSSPEERSGAAVGNIVSSILFWWALPLWWLFCGLWSARRELVIGWPLRLRSVTFDRDQDRLRLTYGLWPLPLPSFWSARLSALGRLSIDLTAVEGGGHRLAFRVELGSGRPRALRFAVDLPPSVERLEQARAIALRIARVLGRESFESSSLGEEHLRIELPAAEGAPEEAVGGGHPFRVAGAPIGGLTQVPTRREDIPAIARGRRTGAWDNEKATLREEVTHLQPFSPFELILLLLIGLPIGYPIAVGFVTLLALPVSIPLALLSDALDLPLWLGLTFAFGPVVAGNLSFLAFLLPRALRGLARREVRVDFAEGLIVERALLWRSVIPLEDVIAVLERTNKERVKPDRGRAYTKYTTTVELDCVGRDRPLLIDEWSGGGAYAVADRFSDALGVPRRRC